MKEHFHIAYTSFNIDISVMNLIRALYKCTLEHLNAQNIVVHHKYEIGNKRDP